MAQRQQTAWKRIKYTFDILDQATEVKLGTLEVDANGYYEAEDEVSAWLDKNPGCMMGEYTRVDNPPPAQRQWKAGDEIAAITLQQLSDYLQQWRTLADSQDTRLYDVQKRLAQLGLFLGGERLSIHARPGRSR